MVIVLAATTMGLAGNDLYVMFTKTLPDAISEAVTGSTDMAGHIDDNFTKIQVAMTLMDAMPDISGQGGGAGEQLKATKDDAMMWTGLGVAGPAVVGGALMMMYKVALALFVGLGPLFVLSLLFEQTKPFFSKWLFYGIGTMFSYAVLAFMVSEVTKIVGAMAAQVATTMLAAKAMGSPLPQGVSGVAMQQGGLGLIMTVMLITIPPMAAAFFNGTLGQFGAYSAFGTVGGRGGLDGAGRKPGDPGYDPRTPRDPDQAPGGPWQASRQQSSFRRKRMALSNTSIYPHLSRLAAAGVLFCALTLVCACKKDAAANAESNTGAATQADSRPAPAPAQASRDVAPPQQELPAIVGKVMESQYGTQQDASLRCWPYTLPAKDTDHDDVDYCMRPGEPHLVGKGADMRLYFTAFNVTDTDAKPPKYAYSQVDTGLFGAFELKQDAAGGWTVATANKAMQYGAAGDCACSDASFIRVGKNTYGWMFESGGDWGGVVVSDHSIVVPAGATFKDVSRIPGMTEGDQDVTYDVQLDTHDPDADMYPLLITETKNDKVVRRLIARYDVGSGGYALPRD